jgi:hypothetical protein
VRRLGLPAMTKAETAEQIELLLGRRPPPKLVGAARGVMAALAVAARPLDEVMVARLCDRPAADEREALRLAGLCTSAEDALTPPVMLSRQPATSFVCGVSVWQSRRRVPVLGGEELSRHPRFSHRVGRCMEQASREARQQPSGTLRHRLLAKGARLVRFGDAFNAPE